MALPVAPRRPALRSLPGGKQTVTYAPRGAARRVLECRDFEVLCEGPVGTGKTYGLLWKAHLAALKYPGMKALLLRKTQKSLTESAIQTYVQKVLPTAGYGVRPFSGNIEEPRSFKYPNGSRFVVAGLDNPGKVMSSEYDIALIFEATQIDVQAWEDITTRLRNGVMPYQQIIADCNPNAPTHWLNQRAIEGKTTRLRSVHQDNPLLWDANAGAWTPFGAEYMARLENLTGVRRKRNLLGLWVAAEGQIYEEWNPEVNMLPATFEIPAEWPRYWCIDFGFVNPFVWQWWAQDPDGRLYLYRQIYETKRLVEDHAMHGLALSKDEPRPVAVITDHDAEDRATFERKTGYRTTSAHKSVSDGIQAVASRLKTQADNRPRLYVVEDSVVRRDGELREAGKPTSTEDEFTTYVWDERKEAPVKEDDHGMDATRYMVAHLDLKQRKAKARGY